jgi:hypothetical protein
MPDDTPADLIDALSKQIAPLLHGYDPGIIGAVLADLTATWLAGWQGSEKDKRKIRRTLLRLHVEQIKALIEANEQLLLERYAEAHAGETRQ